jgi:hypothetical protein
MRIEQYRTHYGLTIDDNSNDYCMKDSGGRE